MSYSSEGDIVLIFIRIMAGMRHQPPLFKRFEHLTDNFPSEFSTLLVETEYKFPLLLIL